MKIDELEDKLKELRDGEQRMKFLEGFMSQGGIGIALMTESESLGSPDIHTRKLPERMNAAVIVTIREEIESFRADLGGLREEITGVTVE